MKKSSEEGEFQWLGTPVVTDAQGIAGQGQANPLSMFQGHVLIAYGNRIYDPSYGKSYANMAAFETQAIAGFVLEKMVNEKEKNIDLNGDGKIEDEEVRVFLFRENGQDQDLI